MVIEALKDLFTRDLNKLKQEINLYQDEDTFWAIEKAIKNSGGNLSLHLVGNLKNYIGNGLAGIGYVRDRDFEFSGKFVDREAISKEIDETIEIVNQGLSQVSASQLNGNFPMMIWKEETGMAYTLIHLHAHLNYHLGQINYHRRILDANAG